MPIEESIVIFEGSKIFITTPLHNPNEIVITLSRVLISARIANDNNLYILSKINPGDNY